VNKPSSRPVVRPLVCTPFQGFMAAAEKLTRAVETRLGGVDLWSGADGVSGVAADLLRGWGVPDQIALGTSERVISPRMVAEQCGILKRRSPKRRLRK